MAKRKSPDKFRVGQRAMLVLDRETGYERRNGQLVTVVRQRIWGDWECSDILSSRAPEVQSGWRYQVRTDRGGSMSVEQCMLRPLYDGERLSTWEKFAKVTGFRVDKPLEAVSIEKRGRAKGARARELGHG
jgi:hypothetical protein